MNRKRIQGQQNRINDLRDLLINSSKEPTSTEIITLANSTESIAQQ